jgi:hypothetical protein
MKQVITIALQWQVNACDVIEEDGIIRQDVAKG